jgi:hypothetical protein
LHAADTDHVDEMKALLAAKLVDVTVTDENGQTALHHAAYGTCCFCFRFICVALFTVCLSFLFVFFCFYCLFVVTVTDENGQIALRHAAYGTKMQFTAFVRLCVCVWFRVLFVLCALFCVWSTLLFLADKLALHHAAYGTFCICSVFLCIVFALGIVC